MVGLTPTVDEHSIKVEGTGSATITDMTVELLPNRDIFEDIYPDSDTDSESNESSDSDDDNDKPNSALEEVRDKLVALHDELTRAEEIMSSADQRLRALDAYISSFNQPRKEAVMIDTELAIYRKEREKLFEERQQGLVRSRQITKDIGKLRREEERLKRIEAKERAKAEKERAKIQRAKEKEREKQQRRKEEKAKEKARIRKERENFWPRCCYTVRITLDATIYSPVSSRRNSIASGTEVVKAVPEKEIIDDASAVTFCDLALSYVTSSAFWSPSYDLSLSTTNNTAVLCFDAHLTNMTSETWTNTRVTLSTSQAKFSGLQDEIPTLTPWKLRIVGKGGPWDGNDIAYSREEQHEKELWNAAQQMASQPKARANLFGISKPPMSVAASQAAASNLVAGPAPPPQDYPIASRPPLQSQAPEIQQIFGAPQAQNKKAERFVKLSAKSPAPPGTMLSSSSRARCGDDYTRDLAIYGTAEAVFDTEAEADTILEPAPEVTFQESSFEETGLTATYDLPNLKTLKPSSTASKQRIARLSFTNVTFTRTVVAKYKPAAYLKARLRNTSKLTLIKGPTGLTLDGTFLGRSTLPRCSAGDTFSMMLGIDPAIKVAYPKPDVTRSTSGVFVRGENTMYQRTITLINTRATSGKPVNLTVLDQVPVSEDEKIRVEILHPKGMQIGGRGVATGVAGREGKEEQEWGKAYAVLKKAGEVSWDVTLNAGKSVKLLLQYEVSFPSGERVAQCW